MTALLARLEPHLDQSAGAPDGAVRAKAPYLGEAFNVGRPERVTPVGAGRLSAMVAYGDRLELQLSTTEYFNAIADDTVGQSGKYVNPLLSPGRISIQLADASAKDLVHFDQRIDFARGTVVIDAETKQGVIHVEVWGDMAEDNLLVSVRDGRPHHGSAQVRYENWRTTTQIQADGGNVMATEATDVIHATGLAAQSMSLAVRVGCIDGSGFAVRPDKGAGTIEVPANAAGNFSLIVSVKCAHGVPPVETARSSWETTARLSAGRRDQARATWWRDFWARSFIDLHGPQADYLMRLWYTTLYSYACVGEGPVPPKFNSGPGMIYKDSRAWGDGYWWQNQREISFWPMAAAGHEEFTRKSILFFNYAFEGAKRSAEHHGLPGLLFGEGNRPGEWTIPFGEYPLVENNPGRFAVEAIDPAAALALRNATKPGYNALNFVGGMEFVQAVFDYVQFTGDRQIEQKIGAPWLKGETLMTFGLLSEGDDHRYHLKCADATEQWWKIDDPAPMLAGIRYLLSMTARHGKELGFEEALITAAKERLDRLAPLPTVRSWDYKNVTPGNYWYSPTRDVTAGDEELAPFAMVDGVGGHNAENPELYAVFPFALVDLNSSGADLGMARRTFDHRFFKNTQGWSQCPVQAARLGLPSTLQVILEHAKKHQVWPYGGWNCAAPQLYAGSHVVDAPFFDSAGVNITALQESLLQSHSPVEAGELLEAGLLRIVPAVSPDWSGDFRLNARGGLVVTVRFSSGKVETAWIEATRETKLQLLNPFARAVLWVNGRCAQSSTPVISADLKRGDRIVVSRPLEGLVSLPSEHPASG